MINHDNLADYQEPYLYDLENQETGEAGAFYLALAQKTGGPVLDLGCGTGRFTIPIAQAGVDITGLDIVPGMLARAQTKASGLAIQWVEADARNFQLSRQFSLIFESGAMFQHLLTRADAEAMLACVRAHLAVNGGFAITVPFPKPAQMEPELEEKEWFRYETGDGRTICVSGTSYYDAVNQIYHETAVRRWEDAQGRTVERIAPLALRRYFPQELESLLHYNGFTVVARYGDWDSNPLTAESPMLLIICHLS
ncbi:MAG: class I SAM-dependent methyltransferase [Anaerolineae bacterium]|nr:class I SAM-dependent methyltransferase [Anaerolineae bacterium]